MRHRNAIVMRSGNAFVENRLSIRPWFLHDEIIRATHNRSLGHGDETVKRNRPSPAQKGPVLSTMYRRFRSLYRPWLFSERVATWTRLVKPHQDTGKVFLAHGLVGARIWHPQTTWTTAVERRVRGGADQVGER